MNHFFDMDGTMAVYERWVYETDGTYPWYAKIRNTHYYQTVKPYDSIVRQVRGMLQSDPGSVYVITSVGVPEEAFFYECVSDKIRWVQSHLPELPPDHFFVMRGRSPKGAKETKSTIAAKLLGRPLNKQDILYDDFNPNLNDWRDAGGTPIKVLNGINSPRKDMKSLYIR